MKNLNIGLVGLGLIGGSIAKTIKRVLPKSNIIAYDIQSVTLTCALQEGIIDSVCTSVGEQFKLCDYIFLCAPVSHNSEYLNTVKEYMKSDCILTDVGSVKTGIHQVIIEQGLEEQFIGGHPMAGSEKVGFHNATDRLFENAYYMITPSGKSSEKQVEKYKELILLLGAIPIVMNYEKHDFITAAISHLPHIIASSLVNLVKDSDSEEGIMKMIAAGGFKDITRIASSSPNMWQQICLTNKNNIGQILKEYTRQLEQINISIQEADGKKLYDMFNDAREYRNSIPDSSLGPIKKLFAVYCDIIDESGGIATIATILATSQINIKNIGIIHNREFEEGVLKVEFYDEDSSHKAVALLKKHHYTVHER